MRLIKVLQSRKGRPIDFPAIEPTIAKLCKKHHIDLFYIFGSYASGKAGPLSDIDVAYLGRADPQSLWKDLQDLFKEEAIDIVDLKRSPPLLTHQILKKGRCLFAKNLAVKINFETHAEAIYFDTEPLRRTYFGKMLRRIKDGTFGY